MNTSSTLHSTAPPMYNILTIMSCSPALARPVDAALSFPSGASNRMSTSLPPKNSHVESLIPEKPEPRTPLPPVLSILAQFSTISDPVNRRAGWTSSRIGIYPDGTLLPILHALAFEKYGPFSTHVFMPYWKDKNWANETWDNIELCERAIGNGMPHRNPYNVPAGTKEYWRAYRAVKRDKIREYQKASAERRKAILKRMEEDGATEIERLLRGEDTDD